MKENNTHDKKDPVEQLQQKPAKDEFLIAGIGASAGGIQALQQFFHHVPKNSGIAYVVILHLSPDHDSQLASVLQRETEIPVAQVTEKVHIKPDHIYVVPPNQHLTMEDGFIAVSENTLQEERRAPVDIFFRTLADEHGPRTVAIILSGTGANGSMGLKRIKERGGSCFVQNPREAEFNEMPRNAIATEMVDEVLPVSDIPAKIISYKKSLGTVTITDEVDKRPEEQQQALREIFTQLRGRTGHDFSNYKRPTLLRRIERRINIRNLPDLPAYTKFLQEHPEESSALLKDLLISVTNFYRDKKPFEMIEHEILPLIFKGKTSEDQVRIWVAGCATGEEAYSVAMLCMEKTMGIIDAPKVQIFATDIDESAIAHAREGLYTLNDTADVSPERLRRFFNKEGDSYRVRREIREMVLFATHNFLKDPPFSRLDMVTCRNVMIYLNQVAQERIIETFHFALNPGGYLFLGTSESVDGASDLYAVYNRENHIFQSRQVKARAYPVPESTPASYFDQFKKERTQENETKILERISFGDLHQQLLEEYASPSIVVNEEYDILHLTERAGKYLQISGGELSQNLLKLVKPELRLELRSALYQARQRQSGVEAKGLKISIEDKTETVNIHVRPVLRSGDTAKGFILVIFEPTTDDSKKEILLSADEPIVKQLEEELVRVKAQLKAANEQHDFQAEEMKASNEELQAMNEELRSAAEELETSKEELQSINEELRTVNQELKVKIEETSIASNNLQNLINSTDIGTIFLDRSFRVVLFTPSVRNIFNLIPADFGRPLSDITHKLEHDSLLTDAETVLDKLTTIEKEVHTKDGKFFLMRLTPYRTDEDRIKGIVITFVDITDRKKADEAMRVSEEKYRTLFNSIDEAVTTLEIIFDENDKVIDWRMLETNPATTKMTGWTSEVVGKKASEYIPGKIEDFWFETVERVVKTGEPVRVEHPVAGLNDNWYEMYLTRIGGEGSNQIVVVYNNVTERKRLEAKKEFIQKLSDALSSASSAIDSEEIVTLMTMDYLGADRCYYCTVEGDVVTVKRDALRGDLPSVSGTYPLSSFALFKKAIDDGHPLIIPDSHVTPVLDEGLRKITVGLKIIASVIIPVIKNGKAAGLFCVVQSTPRNWTDMEIDVATEIAERTWTAIEKARIEEALRKSEERLQRMVNVPQVGVLTFDYNEHMLHANDAFLKMVGYTRENFEAKQFTWREFTPDEHMEASLRVIGQLKKAGVGGPYEKEYYRKDGTKIWMMFVAADLGDGTLVEYAVDISERKQIEEALRKSEAQLRALVENLPGGAVFIVDKDLRYLLAEGEALINAGTKAEDFLGKTVDEVVHEEEIDTHKANYRKAFAGESFEDEHQVNNRTYISRGVPLMHSNGEVYAVLAISYDITDRKNTEEALRKSQERLQKAIQIETVGVIFLNDEGEITEANDAFLQTSGYTQQQITNHELNLKNITPPEWIPAMEKALQELKTKGIATPYEKELLHPDNSRWWALCAKARISENDNIEYIIDVTKRKEAEQSLKIAEERYRIALESAEMGAWDWNIKEDKVIWNEKHFTVLGLEPTAKRLTAESFLHVVHPTDLDYVTNNLMQAVETCGVYHAEFRIIRADNQEVRWMNGYGSCVAVKSGKATRMVGVMFDVTERKRLELQKEEFMSIASHELKTPVTSIKAYTEILMDQFSGESNQAAYRLADKMFKQINRLQTLIIDLLDVTRINEGQLQFRDELFDLNELIDDVSEDVQKTSPRHTIVKKLQPAEKVYADKDRIRQVIINLLTNAIKYSFDHTNVIISSVTDKEKITVSVEDFGRGMTPDVSAKVFDRFYRYKEDKNDTYPGLGLGLFIASGIVKKYGGDIWVESTASKGSTFSFTIPYKE